MHPEQQQVYWYSGLYLQPQHLQSVDLHHSHMLAIQRQLSQPWNVGLIQFDINQDTLIDFSLNIENLKMILPSGYYLEYPGNCVIEPRQFRDLWKQREKPFTLWLTLRRFDPLHPNVSIGTSTRWINYTEDSVMKDVYHDGPESTVPRIAFNVRILSDEEKETAVDCESIPLLRLLYDNDRVILDSNFCPPSVTLSASQELKRTLDGILAEVRSRAYKFEEFKRPGSFSSKIDNADNITKLLTMRSLNRLLPLLELYYKTPYIHPWTIYGLLVQLVGELSSFNDMCSFNGEWSDGKYLLKSYDHYNLIDCFNSIKKILVMLLNSLSLEDNTYITLTPDSNRIFSSDLLTLREKNSNEIFLLLRSEKIELYKEYFAENSGFKLSTRLGMASLIQHSLSGVTASWSYPSPPGAPNRKDSYYFRINQNQDGWKNIIEQKNIAFYWTDAPDDLQVQLIFIGA